MYYAYTFTVHTTFLPPCVSLNQLLTKKASQTYVQEAFIFNQN